MRSRINPTDMKLLINTILRQINLRGEVADTLDLILVLAKLQIKHKEDMFGFFLNPDKDHRSFQDEIGHMRTAGHGALSLWVQYHELFSTRYKKQISLVGLLNFLGSTAALNIQTKGWPIVKKEGTSAPRRRSTRSFGSANLVKYSTVPLPSRILGYIIEHLGDLCEEQKLPLISTFNSPLGPSELYMHEDDPDEDFDTIFPADFQLKQYLHQFLKDFVNAGVQRLHALAVHLPSKLKLSLENFVKSC